MVAYGICAFELPKSLKLSVHSGSDKFSLYPVIRELVSRHGAGLHIKTAGTTWLEEVCGLAEAGGNGLEFVKELYREALSYFDELTAPYATVLDIDRAKLPSPETAREWTSRQFVQMVEHDPYSPHFNPSLRQLFHVAFKLAARKGDRFDQLLQEHADIINHRVHANLYWKHLLKVIPAGVGVYAARGLAGSL